uniref:SMP domain-containing protein n=1 Tax=Setaria digitata TaxID=48799 RepID=A0A915PGZ5_9BILA
MPTRVQAALIATTAPSSQNVTRAVDVQRASKVTGIYANAHSSNVRSRSPVYSIKQGIADSRANINQTPHTDDDHAEVQKMHFKSHEDFSIEAERTEIDASQKAVN